MRLQERADAERSRQGRRRRRHAGFRPKPERTRFRPRPRPSADLDLAHVLLDLTVGANTRRHVALADADRDVVDACLLCKPARGDARAVARHLGLRAVRVPDHDVGRIVRRAIRPRERRPPHGSRRGPQQPSEALRAERAQRAGNGCLRPARSRTSRAVSRGGRSPRTLTRPGIRRIHLRWYAAYWRVRREIVSIASDSGSSAASRSPMTFSAVDESGPDSAARASSAAPRRSISRVRRLDAARELFPRDVEPDDQRGSARFERPQAIGAGSEGRAGFGELERPNHSTAVVRVHTRGGRRIALGEDGVGRLGAEPVVEAAPVLASSRSRGRGHVEVCECGAEVEPRSADDHRRQAALRGSRRRRRAREPTYSATDASWSSSQMSTRCVACVGWFVRIGRPR